MTDLEMLEAIGVTSAKPPGLCRKDMAVSTIPRLSPRSLSSRNAQRAKASMHQGRGYHFF